jgi:sialidase-1
MSSHRFRRSTTFAALAIHLLACAVHAADPLRATVFKNDADGYPIFRIPAIVRAMDGTLLAFCEARQGGDASETDIVLKRSSDGGRTWGLLSRVVDHRFFLKQFPAEKRDITVGNPAPVVDTLDSEHPGRIWMPFTIENAEFTAVFSDDEGSTWSQPPGNTHLFADWGWLAAGPGHSIQIQQGPHRGRLVVACDHRLGLAGKGEDRGPNGAHVMFSDDHGQNWDLGAIDDTYDDGLNANETTVVELNDGRLYFSTRDQNGPAPGTRGEAVSADGGQSFLPSGEPGWKWFRPAPEVLDPPVVECALLRGASTLDGDARDLILFSGPDNDGPSGGGRRDLRIRYSTDEAVTWEDGPLLHTGPAAYSDMVRIDPKQVEIGVLFEAGNANAKGCNRIDFVVFQP